MSMSGARARYTLYCKDMYVGFLTMSQCAAYARWNRPSDGRDWILYVDGDYSGHL